MSEATENRRAGRDDGEGAAGAPPASVRATVAVLVGSVLLGVVLLVVAETTGHPEGGPSLFDLVVRAVAATVLSGFLWRGSRTARLIVLIAAVLNVGILGVTLPFTPVLVLVRSVISLVLLVAVIGLLSTPSARRWCRGGQLDNTAQDAATQRRQQRSHLPVAKRLIQALRDDRDARR